MRQLLLYGLLAVSALAETPDFAPQGSAGAGQCADQNGDTYSYLSFSNVSQERCINLCSVESIIPEGNLNSALVGYRYRPGTGSSRRCWCDYTAGRQPAAVDNVKISGDDVDGTDVLNQFSNGIGSSRVEQLKPVTGGDNCYRNNNFRGVYAKDDGPIYHVNVGKYLEDQYRTVISVLDNDVITPGNTGSTRADLRIVNLIGRGTDEMGNPIPDANNLVSFFHTASS